VSSEPAKAKLLPSSRLQAMQRATSAQVRVRGEIEVWCRAGCCGAQDLSVALSEPARFWADDEPSGDKPPPPLETLLARDEGRIQWSGDMELQRVNEKARPHAPHGAR
jgi:hypothetical protein